MNAHLLCAPISKYLSRGQHHVDISMFLLVMSSCRPRVYPGHNITCNNKYYRFVTNTDTDFINTCTSVLTDTRLQIIKKFEYSNLNQASSIIKYLDILGHFNSFFNYYDLYCRK